jgi:cytochrome c oxidase subunit III
MSSDHSASTGGGFFAALFKPAPAAHKDYEGSKTGMWLFLFTELLLFGALFIIYGVYRQQYTHEFHHAAAHLNVVLGVVNTIVLLTSSLTIVLALAMLQRGKVKTAINLLWGTFGLAGLFLVNKYFEWGAKIEHHLYPGSEHMLELPRGESLFYSLYYVLTGLHGLHVVIGMIFMLFVIRQLKRGIINQNDHVKLENAGLYWHLVDMVWIFLLPLFYLTN